MINLPIIAGSQIELYEFLCENPWLNPDHVTRVTEPSDLLGFSGLVLAIPRWECSPSIRDPRSLLNMIAQRYMQLVVVHENPAHQLAFMNDVARNRFEVKVEGWIDPDKERAAQKVAEQIGLVATQPGGGK